MSTLLQTIPKGPSESLARQAHLTLVTVMSNQSYSLNHSLEPRLTKGSVKLRTTVLYSIRALELPRRRGGLRPEDWTRTEFWGISEPGFGASLYC